MSSIDDVLNLISLLESHLQSMGVDDAEFDSTTGIMGLIDRISDIPPSIGGIDVITNISCNLSSDNIFVGDSITISGVLEADKDDTSSTNVDLEGYLKGANIKIYHNNSLIGTVVTNQNGEYEYNYDNITNIGVSNIYSVFEGTNDYNSCRSNDATLTINEPQVLEITTSKNILSKHHNDNAILSADFISGVNIEIYNADNDTLIGTMSESSNGQYSYTYVANGVGNLNIYAKNGNIISETITLEDCYYYVEGEQSITRPPNNYGILNADKDIVIETGIDYEITFQMKTSTTPPSDAEHRVFWTPSNYYNGGSQPSNAVFWGYATSYLQFGKRLSSKSSSVLKSAIITGWTDWKITKSKSNDRYYAYISGVYWDYYTVNSTSSYTNWKLHWILWSDTTLTLKDIKIKKTG